FVLTDAEVEALRLSPEERALLGPFFHAEDLRGLTGLPPNGQWLIYSSAETSARVRASARLFGHLQRFRFLMELRRETRAGTRPWWEMHWPRRREWFTGPRLVAPQMSARPAFTYAEQPGFVNLSVNVVVCPNRLAGQVLWAVLNGPQTTAALVASTKRRGANIDLGVARIRAIPVPAALPWAEILAGGEAVPALARPAVEAFEAVSHLNAPDAILHVLAAAESALWTCGESSRSRR
ncbi:MAG: hypothetical protein NTY38_20085, partial [Acidobacteria bacterium]|nr:hypothetical protein [Acidobacteriota bacterium]